ncbi:hypothetical protein [Pedobacter cryoconitis]|uniref:Uncharacterized protein n=1 Tax=Pedobacter cryoconitis TaxID=188932 RepID=A0A327S9K1_9SPHI|nr:hypothetical protein [Pedobacter cryoconitis]RAJ25012.1 hypothetical protein LY11_04199 [Pedobacter cryoconitis]
METLYYNTGEMILTINYPIDESGHYCIETEYDTEIGHLFVDGINEATQTPIWKGTTEEVNQIAAELGEFIERSDL